MAIEKINLGAVQKVGYQRTEIISDGATGDEYILFPLPIGISVTCRIITGTNTGIIQETTSSLAEIFEGTADWFTWPHGEITGSKVDIVKGVTALRGVSTGGEIKINIIIS